MNDCNLTIRELVRFLKGDLNEKQSKVISTKLAAFETERAVLHGLELTLKDEGLSLDDDINVIMQIFEQRQEESKREIMNILENTKQDEQSDPARDREPFRPFKNNYQQCEINEDFSPYFGKKMPMQNLKPEYREELAGIFNQAFDVILHRMEQRQTTMEQSIEQQLDKLTSLTCYCIRVQDAMLSESKKRSKSLLVQIKTFIKSYTSKKPKENHLLRSIRNINRQKVPS